MKSTAYVVGAALMVISAVTVAPSGAQHEAMPVVQGGARPAFEQLKTMGGSWDGTVTTVPPMPEAQGKAVHVTLRETSMGNALLHEVKIEGRPDDPITMIYMDGTDLILTHYCDAGNRPRMAGKASPDDRKVDFELLDVAGSTEHGNMHHAVFTPVDANHHVEDWTWMNPGGQTIQAHFDLQRTK